MHSSLSVSGGLQMRANRAECTPRPFTKPFASVVRKAGGSSNKASPAVTVDPAPLTQALTTDAVPAVIQSMSSLDEEARSFRFTGSQLEVFAKLTKSMRNASYALATLAFGNVVVNALEAVEHTHHLAEHAGHHGAEAAGAAVGAVAPSVMVFFEELVRAVSINDVAFCVNELIPAVLIMYSVEPFAKLATGPDEPQMALAMKGVGRLSLSLQQLAWTSGSVAVVLLLLAATEYPPIVGWASATCMVLALARSAALWWVVTQHTTSGEEVARTLAALRGGRGAAAMNPLDRAASWLALGALLQAEPSLHKEGDFHHNGHGHDHGHGHGHGHDNQNHHAPSAPNEAAGAPPSPSALASVASPSPAPMSVSLVKLHYSFDAQEERVLRSLVEAINAAGLTLSLQVLATMALGTAEAATGTTGWVSHFILASQKCANALVLFASGTAFDKALHNDDGNDDTDHLLEGLGQQHSGMTGLFSSVAVLSLALILAGTVSLLVPSLEESPLGVLVGDGVMHASADLLVELLEEV